MERSKVRLLFVMVVVVFLTELLIAVNFTEPFPAILYPSFADIPSYNSVIKKPRIVVFFHNQDSLEIKKEDFFFNMTNVYNNVILTENFIEKNSFQASLKEVRTLNATLGTRKITFDLEEVLDDAQIEQAKVWIAYNLQDILKRDDFNRLEVQWYYYRLSPNADEPLKQGELAEKFVVSLTN